MSDPDLSGNKTVFRPSPLQALKSGGQPPVAPPAPAVATPLPAAKPAVTVASSSVNWRTALIVVFVAVTVLAVGYIVVEMTGRAPVARAAVKTSAAEAGMIRSSASLPGASA